MGCLRAVRVPGASSRRVRLVRGLCGGLGRVEAVDEEHHHLASRARRFADRHSLLCRPAGLVGQGGCHQGRVGAVEPVVDPQEHRGGPSLRPAHCASLLLLCPVPYTLHGVLPARDGAADPHTLSLLALANSSTTSPRRAPRSPRPSRRWSRRASGPSRDTPRVRLPLSLPVVLVRWSRS